jgi:lipopolysaccharide transport system permease protein
MLLMLIYRDLQVKTRRACLGYVWVVAQPLVATGVFTVLVQLVLKADAGQPVPYPVFVLSGMVLWQYFANSLIAGTESFTKNLDLILQVYFPREILVLYPILSHLIDLALGVGLVLLGLLVSGVPVTWAVLSLPVLVAILALLAFGLALLLAPLNAGFHDVARIVGVLLGFAMYAAPVLYPVRSVPEWLRPWLLLNPVATVISAFHAILFAPEALELWRLGLAGGIAIAILAGARLAFGLFERVLADVL